MTAGSFDSGVPRACFDSGNPCCQTAVAGNRAELEQATVAVGAKVELDADQEGDDPRLASNNGLPLDVVLARGQWVT
jgi:hypothetical protein